MSRSVASMVVISENPIYGHLTCRELSKLEVSPRWVRTSAVIDNPIVTLNQDVVLVDLNPCAKSAVAAIKQIKRVYDDSSIIAIGPDDDPNSRIAALEAGADDCLLQQIEFPELFAHVRAVLRRKRSPAQYRLEIGSVALDLLSREVVYGAHHAVLPPQEFALVRLLAEHSGETLSRERLHAALYGPNEDVGNTAVDALIFMVRRKLGRDFIRNVRGLGWTMCLDI